MSRRRILLTIIDNPPKLNIFKLTLIVHLQQTSDERVNYILYALSLSVEYLLFSNKCIKCHIVI